MGAVCRWYYLIGLRRTHRFSTLLVWVLSAGCFSFVAAALPVCLCELGRCPLLPVDVVAVPVGLGPLAYGRHAIAMGLSPLPLEPPPTGRCLWYRRRLRCLPCEGFSCHPRPPRFFSVAPNRRPCMVGCDNARDAAVVWKLMLESCL